MLRRRPLPPILAFALVCLAGAMTSGVASAQEPEADGDGDAAAADADADKPADKSKPAWRTEKNILEIGGYLGAFFPSDDHGLYGEGFDKTPRPLATGFSVGLRIAYLPVRFVGVELEGGVMPSKLDGNGGYKSTLVAARAHVILQMPTRLALFIVGGGGMIGVNSGGKALGRNVDGSLHVGGGLKYYLTPKVVLRIDGRDVVSPAFSKGMTGGRDWAHNGEFTIGASFVLGRKSTKMRPR